MLNESVPWQIAAAIAILVAAVVRPLPRTLLFLIALAHVALVVSVAVFPIPIDHDLTRLSRLTGWTGNAARFVELTPFETIGHALQSGIGSREFTQTVLNVFVLAPFALYGPLLWPRLSSWAVFLPVALAVGCSIEAAQLVVSLALGFPYRSIDIDDAILNTLGIVLVFALSGAVRTVVVAISPPGEQMPSTVTCD
jgi:glycopeptide antibiotics resistance protein